MGQFSNLVFIAAVAAVFWFVAIRPQQQRAKRHAEMLAALKPGEEIVTIGGIYAVVVETGERLRVRVLDGTELEIARQAVGQILGAPAESAGDEMMESAGDTEGEPEALGQDDANA